MSLELGYQLLVASAMLLMVAALMRIYELKNDNLALQWQLATVENWQHKLIAAAIERDREQSQVRNWQELYSEVVSRPNGDNYKLSVVVTRLPPLQGRWLRGCHG